MNNPTCVDFVGRITANNPVAPHQRGPWAFFRANQKAVSWQDRIWHNNPNSVTFWRLLSANNPPDLLSLPKPPSQ